VALFWYQALGCFAMSELFDKAQRAIDLMLANHIAPTPANYEFWYRYVSDFDPELSQAVNACLAKNAILTPQQAEQLRTRYLGRVDADPSHSLIEGAIDGASRKLHHIEESVRSAGDDASAYRDVLQAGTALFTANGDASGQRRLIEQIAFATTSMIERTERLEKQLQASSAEIMALRQDLDTARSESRIDALTGIANRKAFQAYLEAHAARALADRKPLSLIFSDIDHFKQFNDTWGHRMGDEVLRLVGQSLEHLCKGMGYPARYGGEEFVIVLPNKTLEASIDIAEQIRDFVGARMVRAKHSNQKIGRITLSLGIAQMAWGDTLESLIERADAALYQAKERGRNQVCTQDDLEAPQAKSA
jgi:diguanylate cyclase